ncbi:MAG TPA: diacylglycerol kinase family protein [Candidatus Nanopelagicaceae bacterium]|nr:diacylglycerol kinase family protein [Candidatus Nanopelagicaceae bacterium]
MSRSAVLVNPALVPDQAVLRQAILQALDRAGWPEPTWLSTTPEDSGESLVRAALAEGAEVIFACGGDGTVMAAAAALAGGVGVLAVLPMGTGNLLARNLGLPRGVPAGVGVAVAGARRVIDLGEAEGRIFTVAAGIGLDARVLAETSHRVKRLLGWPAYVLAGLRHLGGPSFSVTIRLDQAAPISRQVRSVMVANVGRFPGGLDLLPGALPDDGLLEVVLINPRRLLDWVALIRSMAGRHPRGGRVETFSAAAVEVVAEPPQPREADGEPLGEGVRMSVRVRPRALVVCVPEVAMAAGR